MQAYADYHALSIAALRQWKNADGSYSLPPSLDVFTKDPNYVHPPIVYSSLVLPNYSRILRRLQQPAAAQWLDDLIPQLERIYDWQRLIRAGVLSCVLHGDSWNNNILFRCDEQQRPLQVKMIDWQIARCGHPSVDLLYYVFCATSGQFRLQHLDQLLSSYWSRLKSNLSKLGVDLDAEGYTRDDFMKETRQRFVLCMLMAFFMLPIVLDSKKATDHAQDIKETGKYINSKG